MTQTTVYNLSERVHVYVNCLTLQLLYQLWHYNNQLIDFTQRDRRIT